MYSCNWLRSWLTSLTVVSQSQRKHAKTETNLPSPRMASVMYCAPMKTVIRLRGSASLSAYFLMRRFSDDARNGVSTLFSQ